MCSFFPHQPLRNRIKTNVNKFGFSNHTTLKLGMQALRSYLKVTCKHEVHILSYTKFSAAMDHGENYAKVRPHLVHHLLRKRLLVKFLVWRYVAYLMYETNPSLGIILCMTGFFATE